MYCDSHAHLDDVKFDVDRKEIIQHLHDSKISLVINIGADMQSSKQSIALAEEHNFIYATVGCHPYESGKVTDKDFQQLENMAHHNKVVAIGEIGLDYHAENIAHDIQQELFCRQIELAKNLNLPIIVHDREAHKDCLDIVRNSGVTGVFHCFSGSLEMAKEVIKMGFYISLAGPLTYSNAKNLVETAKVIPLDRMLIETDSPYLAPTGYRGQRNDPSLVRLVADKLAEIKGLSVEDIAATTMQNTRRLFGLA